MSVFSLIPWQNGSGSDVDLSGITAGAEQILAGYQSVDSNGNVVEGGMLRKNSSPVRTTATDYPGPGAVFVNIPETGYYVSAGAGGYGLLVSYSDLASAIGLTADKLVRGVTVIGIRGTGG